MKMEKIIKKYITNNTKTNTFGNLISYQVPLEKILEVCQKLYRENNLPLKIITCLDERKETGFFKIIYVFGVPYENVFLAPFILVKDKFPSLTPLIHEVSNYERKINTFFGLEPIGHPSLRSIILHENWPDDVFPLKKDFDWNKRVKTADSKFEFRKIDGEGIYEIPVGPVHAGIIEPGHFRFSVCGEEILMLEPRLGYCHKGSEKLFEVLSLEDKIKLSERISGDSSFSHALAFCLSLESLSDTKVGDRANFLRVIFCELERIANHLGDIGAIMTDTGFNFGGANGGRLREIVMQMNEYLTGSRFLRGVLKIGGVKSDFTQESAEKLEKTLDSLKKDFTEVIDIAQNTNSLLNRLKDTGVLFEKIAEDHGVIGVPGKAVGFEVDARVDYPYSVYDKFDIKIATEKSGDVYARYRVRIAEVYSSIGIIKEALKRLAKTSSGEDSKLPVFKSNSYAVSVVEGWRGDIVYLVSTDSKGQITRVDVRDPSFINWTVLGHAGEGNMVPDFPLINKSFNLSYTGNDL